SLYVSGDFDGVHPHHLPFPTRRSSDLTWAPPTATSTTATLLKATRCGPSSSRASCSLRPSTPRRSGRPPSGSSTGAPRRTSRSRSEEHTSELQSRENLVCRLLLEKKNR